MLDSDSTLAALLGLGIDEAVCAQVLQMEPATVEDAIELWERERIRREIESDRLARKTRLGAADGEAAAKPLPQEPPKPTGAAATLSAYQQRVRADREDRERVRRQIEEDKERRRLRTQRTSDMVVDSAPAPAVSAAEPRSVPIQETHPSCTVQLRMPSGATIRGTFASADPVSVLFDFAMGQASTLPNDAAVLIAPAIPVAEESQDMDVDEDHGDSDGDSNEQDDDQHQDAIEDDDNDDDEAHGDNEPHDMFAPTGRFRPMSGVGNRLGGSSEGPAPLLTLALKVLIGMISNPAMPQSLFVDIGVISSEMLEKILADLISNKKLDRFTLQRLRPCEISALKLDSYGLATDSLLETINRVCAPSLERLSLRNCTYLTDAGILSLQNAEHLTDLDLSSCRLTDKMTKLFVHTPHLVNLSLAGTKITPVGLLNVVRSLGGALESLSIAKCEGIKVATVFPLLQGLTKIRSLSLAGVPFKTPLMQPDLGSFAGLCTLDLAGTAITDEDVSSVVGRFDTLEELDLTGCGALTLGALRPIAQRCRGLTHLKLPRRDLDYDSVLADLSALPLVRLDLSGCSAVTDAGVSALRALAPTLEVLSLAGTRTGDASAGALSALALLRELALDNTTIGDDGCVEWPRHVGHLETLSLAGTRIGDPTGQCLALARTSGSLVSLNLSRTAITDATLDSFASTLVSLVNLSVDGSAVTPEGCERLQQDALGRFSDVTVVCLGQTFKLHKIILMQSPFFRSLLVSRTTTSTITLRTEGDPRITAAGLEIAIRDLYNLHASTNRRLALVYQNAMSVLCAACFLELQDLADHCVRQIAAIMAPPNRIGRLAFQLDSLDPNNSLELASYGPQHQYATLLSRYHAEISTFCMGSLCRIVAMHNIDGFDARQSASRAAEHGETQSDGATANGMASLIAFLETLPVSWVKRLLECDWLCVRSEFDRYLIAKQLAAKIRAHTKHDAPVQFTALAPPTPVPIRSMFNPVAQVSGLFTLVFGGIGGLFNPKKRRIDAADDLAASERVANPGSPGPARIRDEESDDDTVENDISDDSDNDQASRATAASEDHPGARTTARTEFDPSLRLLALRNEMFLKQIFEKSINFTYMTFPQLEAIKSDGIVPTNLVLESHWLQAELSNPQAAARLRYKPPSQRSQRSASRAHTGASGSSLPPFRFAVRFDNVREQFAAHQHLMTRGVSGGGSQDDDDESAAPNAAHRPLMIYSQPVVCAGTQYRLVLSYEPCLADSQGELTAVDVTGGSGGRDPAAGRSGTASPSLAQLSPASRVSSASGGTARSHVAPGITALIQRSRPATPQERPIAYRIYAFDHREHTLETGASAFEPLTVCDFEGNGHARPLVLRDIVARAIGGGDHGTASAETAGAGVDVGADVNVECTNSVWLVAVVEF
nr:hypothetical protein HK105_006128 [Polyrhizophydium stewartii]